MKRFFKQLFCRHKAITPLLRSIHGETLVWKCKRCGKEQQI